MLQTGSIIAPGVQIYKFDADWGMSSFQEMTYYDSKIGIFLNFFLSKVKLLFEVELFLVITKFLLLFLISFCPKKIVKSFHFSYSRSLPH